MVTGVRYTNLASGIYEMLLGIRSTKKAGMVSETPTGHKTKTRYQDLALLGFIRSDGRIDLVLVGQVVIEPPPGFMLIKSYWTIAFRQE